MEKMQAIAKLAARPGLTLTEAPVPEPGPNDVLIRIKKTSICGTNVHIYNWDAWAATARISYSIHNPKKVAFK